MLTLKFTGLRIPKNIAFDGFNNDPVSKATRPNLSTVDFSGDTMGRIAIIHLIHHLKGISELSATNTITLWADIITRASSLAKQ